MASYDGLVPELSEIARLRRELEAKLGESGRLAEENTRMRAVQRVKPADPGPDGDGRGME